MNIYKVNYINQKWIECDVLFTTDPNYIVIDMDDDGGMTDGQAIYVHSEHNIVAKDICFDNYNIIETWAEENCEFEIFKKLFAEGHIVKISK